MMTVMNIVMKATFSPDNLLFDIQLILKDLNKLYSHKKQLKLKVRINNNNNNT